MNDWSHAESVSIGDIFIELLTKAAMASGAYDAEVPELEIVVRVSYAGKEEFFDTATDLLVGLERYTKDVVSLVRDASTFFATVFAFLGRRQRPILAHRLYEIWVAETNYKLEQLLPYVTDSGVLRWCTVGFKEGKNVALWEEQNLVSN